MKHSLHIKRRSLAAFVAAAGLAATGSASAEIKYIDFWSPTHDNRLCNPAANILTYSTFVSAQRISVARQGKVRVRLIGDYADFATGASDSISGVSVQVFRRGTMDRPGASPMFGGMPQIGYVDVDVDVGTAATLGNGDARALWASGSERIPLRIVDACATNASSGSTSGPSTPPPPPPRIISVGTGTTNTPDLVPQFAPLGLLRRESVSSRRIDPGFCQGLPTPRDPRQAAVGEITVGSPRWGVINASNQGTANTFQVRFSVGETQILDTQTVNGVAGGASQLFTFTRPQSRTRVVRVDALTDLAVKNQYGGLGCFQAIMATGDPLNWEDPRYTVRVDVLNNVNEGTGGESNNVQVF